MRSFLCMRRAQQCRIRQAVYRQAIVTRASRSKARLRAVTIRRRLMAKPCTPHLITRKGYATSVRQQSCQRLCNPQAAQFFKIETANVGGRGGLPSRSLGGSRGPFSHVREWPPWCCGAHAAFSLRALRGKQPLPEGAQKRSSPFGLPLFYFSQMTGFWRSDSTKALAFSTASARGSLTCSPVRMSLQDTTPALISSSPRK